LINTTIFNSETTKLSKKSVEKTHNFFIEFTQPILRIGIWGRGVGNGNWNGGIFPVVMVKFVKQ